MRVNSLSKFCLKTVKATHFLKLRSILEILMQGAHFSKVVA